MGHQISIASVSPDREQLNVAGIPVTGLDCLGGRLDHGIPLVLGGLQVDELAAMGDLEAIDPGRGLDGGGHCAEMDVNYGERLRKLVGGM